MNLVPQTWHGYGFSPVWMRICALRWATWTNRALHVSHLYGFSPLWIRKWVFKFAGRLNWASQIGHLYGLLPKNKLISVFEGYIVYITSDITNFGWILPFSFFSVFDDFGEWLWWWSLQLWLWVWLCLVSVSILTPADCLLLAGCSQGRSTFFFISFWSRNALYAWMFLKKILFIK